MRAFVIIATKGRAKETGTLLDYLQRQTLAPHGVVVVGSEERDVFECRDHPAFKHLAGNIVLSPVAGLTCQRNYGIQTLRQRGFLDETKGDFFCAFFDDDFRPADDWLEKAADRFAKGDIVGLTGRVLADGVMTGGLSEEQATNYLAGTIVPEKHWANTTKESFVDCAYGCNMAFNHTVIRQCRFDENLPLYSWQEDYDYTGQALAFGPVVRTPNCRGVHMGVSGGRTSGLRFGYSQVANPLYLMGKGTMPTKAALRQIARNFAANMIKSIRPPRPDIDYWGRLRGNFMAIGDKLCGRGHPSKILEKASFES